MDVILKNIINGISKSYGKDFFNAITLELDKAISSDYTFIARLDTHNHVSKTVALVIHQKVLKIFNTT